MVAISVNRVTKTFERYEKQEWILDNFFHTTGKIEVLNYNPFKKEKAYKKSITLLLGQKQQLWWDVSAKDNYLLLKDIYEEVKKALRSVVCMKGQGSIR